MKDFIYYDIEVTKDHSFVGLMVDGQATNMTCPEFVEYVQKRDYESEYTYLLDENGNTVPSGGTAYYKGELIVENGQFLDKTLDIGTKYGLLAIKSDSPRKQYYVGFNSTAGQTPYDLPQILFEYAQSMELTEYSTCTWYTMKPQVISNFIIQHKNYEASEREEAKHNYRVWKTLLTSLKLSSSHFVDAMDIRALSNGGLKFLTKKYLHRDFVDELSNDLETLIKYNVEDLKATADLFDMFKGRGHVDILESMVESLNIKGTTLLDTQNLMNKLVASPEFKDVNEEFGINDHLQMVAKSTSGFKHNIVDFYVNELTPKKKAGGKRVLRRQGQDVIKPKGIHKNPKPYTLDGVEIMPSLGGVHSSVRGIHMKTVSGKLYLYNIDFASFYPSVYKWLPIWAKQTMDMLRSLIELRVSIKKSDPLKAEGLKLALNSLYGKMKFMKGQPNNYVTSACQVIMLEAIEHFISTYEDSSIRILQINTDGFIVAIDREISGLELNMSGEATPSEYKHRTPIFDQDFTLEIDELSEVYIMNVNNYILLFENGKRKMAGNFVNSTKATNTINIPHYEMLLEAGLSSQEIEARPWMLDVIFRAKRTYPTIIIPPRPKKGETKEEFEARRLIAQTAKAKIEVEKENNSIFPKQFSSRFNPFRISGDLQIDSPTPFKRGGLTDEKLFSIDDHERMFRTWEAKHGFEKGWLNKDNVETNVKQLITLIKLAFIQKFRDVETIEGVDVLGSDDPAVFFITQGKIDTQRNVCFSQKKVAELMEDLKLEHSKNKDKTPFGHTVKVALNRVRVIVFDIDLFSDIGDVKRSKHNDDKVRLVLSIKKALSNPEKSHVVSSAGGGLHLYTTLDNLMLPFVSIRQSLAGEAKFKYLLKDVELIQNWFTAKELKAEMGVSEEYTPKNLTFGGELKSKKYENTYSTLSDFLKAEVETSILSPRNNNSKSVVFDSLAPVHQSLLTKSGFRFNHSGRSRCKLDHGSGRTVVILEGNHGRVSVYCHACTTVDEKKSNGIWEVNLLMKEALNSELINTVKNMETASVEVKTRPKVDMSKQKLHVVLDNRPTGSGKTHDFIVEGIKAIDAFRHGRRDAKKIIYVCSGGSNLSEVLEDFNDKSKVSQICSEIELMSKSFENVNINANTETVKYDDSRPLDVLAIKGNNILKSETVTNILRGAECPPPVIVLSNGYLGLNISKKGKPLMAYGEDAKEENYQNHLLVEMLLHLIQYWGYDLIIDEADSLIENASYSRDLLIHLDGEGNRWNIADEENMTDTKKEQLELHTKSNLRNPYDMVKRGEFDTELWKVNTEKYQPASETHTRGNKKVRYDVVPYTVPLTKKNEGAEFTDFNDISFKVDAFTLNKDGTETLRFTKMVFQTELLRHLILNANNVKLMSATINKDMVELFGIPVDEVSIHGDIRIADNVLNGYAHIGLLDKKSNNKTITKFRDSLGETGKLYLVRGSKQSVYSHSKKNTTHGWETLYENTLSIDFNAKRLDKRIIQTYLYVSVNKGTNKLAHFDSIMLTTGSLNVNQGNLNYEYIKNMAGDKVSMEQHLVNPLIQTIGRLVRGKPDEDNPKTLLIERGGANDLIIEQIEDYAKRNDKYIYRCESLIGFIEVRRREETKGLGLKEQVAVVKIKHTLDNMLKGGLLTPEEYRRHRKNLNARLQKVEEGLLRYIRNMNNRLLKIKESRDERQER